MSDYFGLESDKVYNYGNIARTQVLFTNVFDLNRIKHVTTNGTELAASSDGGGLTTKARYCR